MMIEIPVSIGELVDKITILKIKAQKITDSTKLNHVKHELGLLESKLAALDGGRARFEAQERALQAVNETLWQVEDDLREREAQGLFDQQFIEWARLVYITNDRRFALKNEVNALAGSAVREVKSYQDYTHKKS